MDALKNLTFISSKAGERVDYTQGGGGNTSAKIDDTRMAVKASGFQLKQINETTGFVVVDYKKIKDFYNSIDSSSDRDWEAEASVLLKESVLDFEGVPRLRPSVEAGFHSILKKYIIHTHSVYVNILMCSADGKELIKKIFEPLGYKYFFVPYVDPGFTLTCEIARRSNEIGCIPDVIFMENHGLVVTSDDAKECVAINDAVNDAIIKFFNIEEKYPTVCVKEVGEGIFESDTPYLKSYIKDNAVTPQLFADVILYPDQLVYLNGGTEKMKINCETGAVKYTTTEKEAQTIEETFCAYIYVIDKIKKSGLKIQTMGEAGVEFINNWESEKYRKALAK